MTHDANCPDAETLAAWYDRGLTPAEHAQIESHVSACDRCQALVATIVQTDAAVHPEQGRSGRERSWLSWRWLAPLTAAAAAAVLWAIVRPPPPVAPPAPASVSARAEPSLAPAPAPEPSAIEPRSAAPERRNAPVSKPAAPAPAPPAELNEAKRADERAGGTIATASPAAPLAAPPAQASPPVAAPAAAARLMQANADAMAASSEIVSTDPAIRWRLRGAIVERTTDAGATWIQQPTGTSALLAAGASPSSDVCWIVGRNGTVLRTVDGRTWQAVAFPERVDLIRVEAAGADSATVTAADARRFTTDDGGATWKPGGLQEF